MAVEIDTLGAVRVIAGMWVAQHSGYPRRWHVERADFRWLAGAEFGRQDIPAERGGLWTDAQRSMRFYANLIYTFAREPSSVVLVAIRHWRLLPVQRQALLLQVRHKIPYVYHQ